MVLGSGITGFCNVKSRINEPQVASVSPKEFKKVCYLIEQTGLYRIIEFDKNQIPKNFYYCLVDLRGKNFYILINKYYPYLCFASNIENKITFNCNDSLEKAFKEHYSVLHLEEISKFPDKEDVRCLNEAELKQLRYFNPDTIGEIIYNYWD